MRNAYSLIGKLKRRDHSKDLGADGRVVLKWSIGKQGRRIWIEFTWLRIGTIGGLL
jgi:hypothetical protein